MSAELRYAIVIPLANEEKSFPEFSSALARGISQLKNVRAYLVVDNASRDSTLSLCRALSAADPRIITLYAPDNKNVVDAYLHGLRRALDEENDFIIEMDAGMSHNPAEIGRFIEAFGRGYECVFGSRFITGGSISQSSGLRKMLSITGTFLSNLLLGTRLRDMTSGFQGFSKHALQALLSVPLRSKGHFYQTEVRYLMRNFRWTEVPISYRAASPGVSAASLRNAIATLLFYLKQRLLNRQTPIHAG